MKVEPIESGGRREKHQEGGPIVYKGLVPLPY